MIVCYPTVDGTLAVVARSLGLAPGDILPDTVLATATRFGLPELERLFRKLELSYNITLSEQTCSVLRRHVAKITPARLHRAVCSAYRATHEEPFRTRLQIAIWSTGAHVGLDPHDDLPLCLTSLRRAVFRKRTLQQLSTFLQISEFGSLYAIAKILKRGTFGDLLVYTRELAASSISVPATISTIQP